MHFSIAIDTSRITQFLAEIMNHKISASGNFLTFSMSGGDPLKLGSWVAQTFKGLQRGRDHLTSVRRPISYRNCRVYIFFFDFFPLAWGERRLVKNFTIFLVAEQLYTHHCLLVGGCVCPGTLFEMATSYKMR